MEKIKGVLPALVTPLTEKETLNRDALVKLINYLSNHGADGFYVGGATGEGIALKSSVRMELAEAARDTCKDKPVIIHVASADFGEAIELAKHAERIGADAISAIPPLFFKYDEDDVFNYYKALADAVHIPLIIYYNPAAGFKINAEFAARCFKVDNITGIKWTSSDYFGMIRLKYLTNGEMNIINGPDEMLLMGLNAGADAGIGTTYNFMCPLIKSIYEKFTSGDIEGAKEAQTKADRIIAALLSYSTIPVTKVILEKMGFAVGNCVFPMKRYTEEQKEKIVADFRAAGLEI